MPQKDRELNHGRRRFVRNAGALGALGLTGTAGCLGSGGGEKTPNEDDPLKIGVYGGVFKEVLDSALIEPFSKEMGIAVESKPQSVGDSMNKLKQAVDSGKAPVDVVVVAPDARIRGQNLDVWHNYDPAKISRLDSVVDELVNTTDDGQLIGVGGFGWFLNITTNTNVIDEPIDTWKAFWDSKYEGQLGANKLPGDGFLMDIAAHVFDEFDGRKTLETEDGIERVMKKVDEVNSQVGNWWAQEAEVQQPLKEGNIGATQLYNDISLVMKDKGAPVKTRFPKEGGVMNFGAWSIVKSTDFAEEAEQFVDYAVKPGVQEQITKSLFTAPTIKQGEMELSEEMYEKVYGPGPDAALHPYNELYLEKEEFISKKWKQIVMN